MSVVTRAARRFADEGLAFPKLPADLASLLVELGPWTLSTRESTPSCYSAREFIHEFEDDAQRADYAVIEHSGHGAGSWQLSRFVVCNGLGTFVQSSWGSSYSDEAQRARDAGRFAERCAAVASLHDAVERRPLEPDRRLGVVITDHDGQRWATWTVGHHPQWSVVGDAAGAAASWLESN